MRDNNTCNCAGCYRPRRNGSKFQSNPDTFNEEQLFELKALLRALGYVLDAYLPNKDLPKFTELADSVIPTTQEVPVGRIESALSKLEQFLGMYDIDSSDRREVSDLIEETTSALAWSRHIPGKKESDRKYLIEALVDYYEHYDLDDDDRRRLSGLSYESIKEEACRLDWLGIYGAGGDRNLNRICGF